MDKVKKASVFVGGSLSMAGIVPLEKLPDSHSNND
jgi:hypothetical protein